MNTKPLSERMERFLLLTQRMAQRHISYLIENQRSYRDNLVALGKDPAESAAIQVAQEDIAEAEKYLRVLGDLIEQGPAPEHYLETGAHGDLIQASMNRRNEILKGLD